MLDGPGHAGRRARRPGAGRGGLPRAAGRDRAADAVPAPAGRRRGSRRRLRTGRPARRAGRPMTRPRCSTSGPVLADRRTKIVVTCGSGGVGKTTTAAAMALWAADAGPQGRRADHRPGQAARPVPRPGGTRQRPAPGGHRARRHRRRAVGDDARHPADLRRDGRRALHPGPGRRDPGEPVLQGDLHLVLRHPGVHGDGEAEHAGRHRTSST